MDPNKEVASPSIDPNTGVSSKDTLISPATGVSARLYLPNIAGNTQEKLPILVYFHGGGFCSGSPSTPVFHNYLNSLVAQTKAIAVSVDYRLAPKHPIPTPYDDSWLALQWVASNAKGGPEAWLTFHADFERIFLMGDSAGANIAHQMAIRAAAEPLECGVLISRLVLIHPYFLGSKRLESETMDPEAAAMFERMWKMVCPSTTGYDDPYINPLADGAPSLRWLACKRVLVCVAGKDVLRDRGRAYYEGLRRTGLGGVAELLESEGENHVFHLYNRTGEIALALDRAISRFLLRN